MDARTGRGLQETGPRALRGRRQSLLRHSPPVGRRHHRAERHAARPRAGVQRLSQRTDRGHEVRGVPDVMPVTRIKDALVSMLWTYTGAALLLVPVLTVALVLNQW